MYRVLFVDDDDCILFLLQQYQIFKEGEFQISGVAQNGREALELLKKQSFDLVVTDIRMPVLDGLGLINEMRKARDQTPVILTSTYTEFSYAQQALRLNVSDYIEKPLTEEKLTAALAAIKPLLEEQQSAAEDYGDILEYVSPEWLEDVALAILFRNQSALQSFASLEDSLPEKDRGAILQKIILPEIWEQVCRNLSWVSLQREQSFNSTTLLAGMAEIIAYLEDNQVKQQDELVYRICSAIPNALHEEQLMDHLAEKLELSKDYMSRKFRERTGIRLNKFITLLKIESAKKLLLSTTIKVYEICELLGFSSVDYFSKLFKEQVGTTPSDFRKHNKN